MENKISGSGSWRKICDLKKEKEALELELQDKARQIHSYEEADNLQQREIRDKTGKIHSLENDLNKLRNQICDNDGIHDRLMSALDSAREEIDIMSPWITLHFFRSTRFKEKVVQLVKRGTKVKIAYGTNSTDSRLQDTLDSVRDLQEHVESNAPNNARHLVMKQINTHGKLFICDERYYVITSMNPLSNDGSTGWEEIGEKSQNLENLKKYRKKYFNF